MDKVHIIAHGHVPHPTAVFSRDDFGGYHQLGPNPLMHGTTDR